MATELPPTPAAETRHAGKRTKRKVAALVAGISAIGVAGASAATLGGLTVTNLGADVETVASCDTDGLDVTFTNTYHAGTGTYRTTAVVVSDIAVACTGQTLSVTLAAGDFTALGAGSVPVAGASATVVLDTPAPAASVGHVAVLIADA